MKKGTIDRAGLLMFAIVAMVISGCGTKITRQAGVSDGDYYSVEEFKNLSKEQRDAYCENLDQELWKLQAETEENGTKTEAQRAELAQTKSELDALQKKYAARKAELDGLQEEVDYFEGLPKMHVVEDGEFLQKISEYERIYADATKWPRIYRANKDKVEDPNLIFPGQELTIPRDWPSMWTVQQDEFLGKIAGYWEVYGDPSKWTDIFEANRDQVSDADMIWPGWELTIPRD